MLTRLLPIGQVATSLFKDDRCRRWRRWRPRGLGCAATPCDVEVPRKEPFTATVSKPGYKSAEVAVTTGYGERGRAIMALNVLGGGIGGALGTEASGQGYEHSPNPVVVELKKAGAASARPRRAVRPRGAKASEPGM